MSFHLNLRTHEQALRGVPVVVDVLDDGLHVVDQRTVRVNQRSSFDLPAGQYALQVTLPSGDRLTETVTSAPGSPDHDIALWEISPHESMQRTVVLKSGPAGGGRRFTEPGFQSLWVRLWTRVDGVWGVGAWPDAVAHWDDDAVAYVFPTGRRPHMLQIGGPRIPWRMVSLPAAEELEVTVQPAGDEQTPNVTLTVATEDNLAEATLGYLTAGAVTHAGLISDQAEDLLNRKTTNPAGAAVGGYFLLRTSSLERLHNWPRNLANWMQWMPDGALIHAWQLIREQQESREPVPARLDEARELLLVTVERGLPVYTEGLRLLVSGLKLFDFQAEGADPEIRDALDRIRPFVAAADLTQPTTSFLGSGPSVASTAPAYGLPRSRRGLAIVYDVAVADLVPLGLVEAGTSLWLNPPPVIGPAEAQMTPHGTVRLADGREFTDLFAAAAAANRTDIWYSWVAEDSGPLAFARDRARRGQLPPP
ncbi:hypothetical protein GCM10022226_68730 [Sphaerisporangium flaviroseum]|uniref:Uncharacterized protein n=1 Tax=Sphaerisporangium flaviroseum TaxID=509199 RepID=A0ABP7J8J6_9ACTN